MSVLPPSVPFPRRFGRYILVRPLGGGGMGDVLLALEPAVHRLCVLKRLTLAVRDDSTSNARFRREAAVAGQLSHASIVETLGFEEIEGELVLVQEFLHGRNLAQVVALSAEARQPIPVPLALHVVRELALALDYAHGQGVVHRDVAPENVMLTFSGDVKLVDFGIARGRDDVTLTAPGSAFGGRHLYLAPELLAGGPPDPRADLYSLGIVLWQLLARRPLTFVEASAALAPPSTANPELSSDLDALALRAAARDPATRFATAADMAAAAGASLPDGYDGRAELAAFLRRNYDVTALERRIAEAIDDARQLATPSTTGSLSIQQPRPGDRRLATAGAVFALAGAAVVFLLLRARTPTPVSRPAVTAPPAAVVPKPVAAIPAPLPDARQPSPATVTPEAARPPAFARPERSEVQRRPRRPPPLAPAVEPDSPAPATTLDAAAASFDAGDLAAASNLAAQVVHTPAASAATRSRAQVLLGQIAVKRRDFDAAERAFTAALQLDATNLSAADRLAAVRSRRETP